MPAEAAVISIRETTTIPIERTFCYRKAMVVYMNTTRLCAWLMCILLTVLWLASCVPTADFDIPSDREDNIYSDKESLSGNDIELTTQPITEDTSDDESKPSAPSETEPETYPIMESDTEATTENETESVTETETGTEMETESDMDETESKGEEETMPETENMTETETETETEHQPDGTLPFVPSSPETIDSDWKAIWLSQFDLTNMYVSNGTQRAENDFRTRISKVLDNVKADGYNTIIVQVRPYADSMYPSDVYPPSRYTVGNYANSFTYDPFATIVRFAKLRGLSVHAWINPIRGMTDTEIQQVDDRYLIKQWYNDSTKRGDYLVSVSDRWYLNPAHPEVRRLICDGATEILSKYDVDGIHLDDYFYPTTDASFDRIAYNAYVQSGGQRGLMDWRRENVDAMVAELYATVKTHDLRALFGISPAGNINAVYDSHCADVYRWCSQPGYIDYICPQIYFGFDHATLDFVKGCEIWSGIIQTDYVSLIIGLTFEKAVSGVDNYAGAAGKYEWRDNKDILARELTYTTTLNHCVGVTVFCYQTLYDIETGAILPASQQEHEAFNARLSGASWHT